MAITTQAKLDETALLELESSLRGELLRPDHPSYESSGESGTARSAAVRR